MFNLPLTNSERYCDGVSRRSFLQLGIAGMGSLALPDLLRAKSRSSQSGTKSTSTILIWLDGGPSHMDLYDLKPEAPAEFRGIWKPIKTNVPGFEISEMFPQQAKVANLFSIVRSLHHDTGDHFVAGHRMLTTKDLPNVGNSNGIKFPSIGAIVNRSIGAREQGIPGYIGIPYCSSIGLSPGYFGADYLGAQHNPFQTGGSPNSPDFSVKNFNLAQGLTLEKLNDRKTLLKEFDLSQRGLQNHVGSKAMDQFNEEAFQFITGSRAKKAFDLGSEDPKLRDKYGRNDWGQSALLARRLVEAGSTFVTIHLAGWDHHWDLKKSMENYLPKVDSMVASLFSDLEDRGLLSSTLVVLCGEFSRTPRMNNGGNGGAPMSMGTPGRDHWGNSMFCLMGGGGVKGGMIVGSTDRLGEHPKDRPLLPSNIHATIYEVLGIDPKLQLIEPSGRPVNVLDDPEPIRELL